MITTRSSGTTCPADLGPECRPDRRAAAWRCRRSRRSPFTSGRPQFAYHIEAVDSGSINIKNVLEMARHSRLIVSVNQLLARERSGIQTTHSNRWSD